MNPTEKELEAGLPLRCFCNGHPLLARWGRHRDGDPWIHVKTWKRDHLMAEILATLGSGMIRIRCRNCLRWHSVKIVRGTPALSPESPESPGTTDS